MCIRDSPNIEISGVKSLLEKRVDGFIIASVGQDFAHIKKIRDAEIPIVMVDRCFACLLYTSDAADERSSVDLGGRRIITKKKKEKKYKTKKNKKKITKN